MSTRAGRRAAVDRHPEWCAQGHRCNLGEHRADPVVIDAPGTGRVALTRVRTTNGAEHAEVRLTIALSADVRAARRELLALTQDLADVLHRADRSPDPWAVR